MSSIKPDDGGGQVDSCEEVSGGFVIACGNGAKLFKFAEEILDEVALFVQFFVEGARVFAVALGRDHGSFSGGEKRFHHALVGVVSLVRQQHVGCHQRHQRVGAIQIVRLSRRQIEGERIAKRIGQTMDFSAQTAFAASDRLVFVVFF